MFVLVWRKGRGRGRQRESESMSREWSYSHVYFTVNVYIATCKSGECVDFFVNMSGKSYSQWPRAFSPSLPHIWDKNVSMWQFAPLRLLIHEIKLGYEKKEKTTKKANAHQRFNLRHSSCLFQANSSSVLFIYQYSVRNPFIFGFKLALWLLNVPLHKPTGPVCQVFGSA